MGDTRKRFHLMGEQCILIKLFNSAPITAHTMLLLNSRGIIPFNQHTTLGLSLLLNSLSSLYFKEIILVKDERFENPSIQDGPELLLSNCLGKTTW